MGTFKLIKKCARAHVLCFAAVQYLAAGRSEKGKEIARLAVRNKILCKLRKKYRRLISEERAKIEGACLNRERSRRVWVCWLQGMDKAPWLVHTCFESLQKNLKDREIVLITSDNYRDYTNFPDYIGEKYQRGQISRTHFSDLLRVELLARHGGTWIDATVFCSSPSVPSYMLDSDLFLFRNLSPTTEGHPTCISSWFITACKNEEIILLTRTLLFDYWKKKNHQAEYFLFHDMMQLAIEAYPSVWERVIPFANAVPHIMQTQMKTGFDRGMYEAVCAQTPFHKLSYKDIDEEKARRFFEELH